MFDISALSLFPNLRFCMLPTEPYYPSSTCASSTCQHFVGLSTLSPSAGGGKRTHGLVHAHDKTCPSSVLASCVCFDCCPCLLNCLLSFLAMLDVLCLAVLALLCFGLIGVALFSCTACATPTHTSMYTYIYICIYICIYLYIHMF